ncbi:MAG: hypothetical protein ACT4QF_05255 [Sporichthyaceae bacterium]
MSEDEELRRMLSRLDPMDGVPVEPVTSPQARHLLEQIMQSTQTEEPASAAVLPLRRRPRAILAAAASVAVLALGIGVSQLGGGDGGAQTADLALTSLALKAPGGDPAMQMCLAFDAEGLRTMPVAFAGTATAVGAETVTIDVDRWFRGGDTDLVTIALPPGDLSPALIPGVEFATGQRYLVTATDGTVNGCGFSGPATPGYEKAFDEAFGG